MSTQSPSEKIKNFIDRRRSIASIISNQSEVIEQIKVVLSEKTDNSEIVISGKFGRRCVLSFCGLEELLSIVTADNAVLADELAKIDMTLDAIDTLIFKKD
jgi:hypothetical protein